MPISAQPPRPAVGTSSSRSTAPHRVALIDTPADPATVELDRETMSFVAGGSTLAHRNYEGLATLTRAVEWPAFREHTALLGQAQHRDPVVRAGAAAGAARVANEPDYAAAHASVQSLHHGTQVAVRIRAGARPHDVALTLFPLSIPLTTKLSSLAAARASVDDDHRDAARELASLDAAFTRTPYSAANLSVSFPSIEQWTANVVTDDLRARHPADVHALAVESIGTYVASFRALFERHPETAFVVAAGNESRNLDDDSPALSIAAAARDCANVVVVGASDGDDLWDRTNYGEATVDLLTPGAHVPTTGFGGERLDASGTSIAAPHATAELVKIHAEHPQLARGAERIGRLLQNVRDEPNFEDAVRNRAFLP